MLSVAGNKQRSKKANYVRSLWRSALLSQLSTTVCFFASPRYFGRLHKRLKNTLWFPLFLQLSHLSVLSAMLLVVLWSSLHGWSFAGVLVWKHLSMLSKKLFFHLEIAYVQLVKDQSDFRFKQKIFPLLTHYGKVIKTQRYKKIYKSSLLLRK